MLPSISASLENARRSGSAESRPRPVRRFPVFRSSPMSSFASTWGGWRTGVVNLVNRMPRDRYRHAIVCLAGYTDFSRRIERRDVPIFDLAKAAGQQPGHALEALAALRAIAARYRAHAQPRHAGGHAPAALARVPVRIHGEHGRDMDDLDGSSTSRQRIRRLFKPFVHRYITVSRDLASYLERKVGVPPARITQIYNGVETEAVSPGAGAARLARLRRGLLRSRHGRAHAARQGSAQLWRGRSSCSCARCRAPSGGSSWR